MDFLPDNTMEQATHKMQDKGGIKTCNISIYMVDSLYNCRNSEVLDNNHVSISHINFLYEEAKRNHLIDEISRNLQLEFKGLVAQQYTEVKHEIKSMYDNNDGETIKDAELEISYLKGKLANTNQLLSKLHKKNSTCFIQGDAFLW